VKIRYRLTFWYYAVTLTILLLFSVGVYLGAQHLLYMAFDEELNIVVDSIERGYNENSNDFDELNRIPKSLNPFAEYYLTIHDKNGNPVYESGITQKVYLEIPLSKSVIEKGYTEHIKAKIIKDSLNIFPDKEITFRIISRQLFYKQTRIGWATIGLPITQIEDSLQQFLFVLLIAVFGALILIGVGGFYLTSKSLHPVDLITRRAKQISHSNLSERIEVKNEDDELGQLSTVLNDLLDRLHKAFISQQEFLADAAHELKTPLSILRLHWESEINNPNLTLELKEKLVQDVETITRLSHLINNLLLLSKTEAVNLNFELKNVRLDEILEEVVTDASILAKFKGQEIVIVDFIPVMVNGDKLRLYQLFFNLIDNAIKYSPENESILISLRIKDDYAIIEIKDNGSGIPPNDTPNIFKRFYRVQKDRARRSGGSGLGLAICKLIVESHGGSIEVISELKKGSTFKVKLPKLRIIN
jgi:signal transduction histidine kinase